MSKLHPWTKLFMLLCANLMLFLHVSLRTEILMTALFLLPLFLGGKVRSACRLGGIYIGCLLANVILLPHASGLLALWLSMLTVSCRMLLPCLIAGVCAFATTPVSEFVCAMRGAHIPERIIIPCMVTIRFFPVVREDYRRIRHAMAYRGIGENAGALLLHPVQTLEYILVPLLMNASFVAEDLAISALMRGIGLEGTHSSIMEIRLRFADICYMVLLSVVLIVGKGFLR